MTDQATRYEEPIIERRDNKKCTIFILTASGNLFRFIILCLETYYLIEISTETGARIFELDKLHLDLESETPTVMYTHAAGVYNAHSCTSFINEASEWRFNDSDILYRLYTNSDSEDPIHKLFWFYRSSRSIIDFMHLSKDFNRVLKYIPNDYINDDTAVMRVLTHLSKDYLSKFHDRISKESLEDEPSFYEYLTALGVNSNFILELNDLVEGLTEYHDSNVIAPILFPNNYLLTDETQSSDRLQLAFKTAREFRDLFDKCNNSILFLELVNGIANVVRVLRPNTYQPTPQQADAFNSLAGTIAYGRLDPGLAKKYLYSITLKAVDGGQLVSSDFDVLLNLQDLQPDLHEEDFEL